MQDELDLGWMDYGARFYDPALGRWHSVDPLAENYYSWTSYKYGYDNPLLFIDPDGRGEIYGMSTNSFTSASITTVFDESPDYVTENGDRYESYEELVQHAKNNNLNLIPNDETGSSWTLLGNQKEEQSGVGPSAEVYGPDSPESRDMNIDEAIEEFYKLGGKETFRTTYEFSDFNNLDRTVDNHLAALSPMRLTTGGYTIWVSPGDKNTLKILIGNSMSANSFFGHFSDFTGIPINYSRVPVPFPQPFSTTYQFFIINRPAK